MRDQDLQDIESELRRTAGDLFRMCDRPAPVHALLAEHGRRRKRRLARRAASVVGLLLVGAVASLSWVATLSRKTGDPGPRANTVAVSPSGAGERDSASPPRDATANPAHQQPIALPPAAPDNLEGSSMGAPVLVSVILAPARQDGESVVTTAIYVPEHTEFLDFQDLSPAEQDAVRRVLGPEERTEAQLSL